ncbi:MAG: GIY-YIG nuclease family protein [Clostridia bacterium]|nr:GIY-YIG nuclease family protein [Clostridia bacterium]
MKTNYVYILSNYTNTTLYIGVTSDIYQRMNEHNDKVIESFTSKYNLNKLVYVEEYSSIVDAIAREKQLKGWRRERKNDLINSVNPEWKDLLKDN